MSAAISGSFDLDTDLLVVGGGVAGAAAAIAAADLGGDVLLVEKTEELGGNCRYSDGNLLGLGSHALEHLTALCFGRTDIAVLQAYCDGLDALPAWLNELGLSFTDTTDHLPKCWPNLPGAAGVRYYAVRGDGSAGPALWRGLATALQGRELRVETNTSVEELIVEHGAVVGAVVKNGTGGSVRVSARRGVVLSTGGFENAPNLCESYLPATALRAVGHSGNTGDGLRLAQSVGADVWHMSSYFGFWALAVDAHPTAFPVMFLDPGHLLVAGDGRRFGTETGREAHDLLRTLGNVLPSDPHYPQLPAYAILDDRALRAGPLSFFPSPNDYIWSADNSAEVGAGWIACADSVGELAQQLDIDHTNLVSTLERFNNAARTGDDHEFHRQSSTMRPLEGRLYGMRVWPGVATTAGGPRRDAMSRVLDRNGNPVPGLYAAGGNGSVWGHLTEHGGGLTDGLVFGRIAAHHALDS